MPTTHCIECEEAIELEGRARIGQKVSCAHCGAVLEVVSTDPIELDWADDEDWEDEMEENGDLDELDGDLEDEDLRSGLLIEGDLDVEIEEELEEDLDDEELEDDELEDELDEDDFEFDDDDEFDDEFDDDFGDEGDDDRRWR